MHIILFDDHELFAKTMQYTLSSYFDKFEYFSENVDILNIILEKKPNIVLLDIHMGHVNGLDIGRKICELTPDAKLIFLSGYDLEAYHKEAFSMGASAFINKNTSLDDLIAKIKFVSEGNTFFSQDETIVSDITDRELEILKMAADGSTQLEIAQKLFISRRTVNSHIQSITSKLDVNSTVAAIVKGIELGLIKIRI